MGRDRNRELIEESPLERNENRELVAEYPWLDTHSERYTASEFTLLDLLPWGWRDLILDMCKEIKKELVKYDLVSKYQVVEAKEKWYGLSWYDGLDDFSPMPPAITDIVCKYEMQSREVCMMCGRPKPKDQLLCDRCMERYKI